MIFVDSWIWVQFFEEGHSKGAEDALRKAFGEVAVINTVVIMEVKYVILKKYGKDMADSVTNTIEVLPNIRVLPVTSDVAKLAADIRKKYYKKERQMSYADALNAATAILSGCSKLCSGDPDFAEMDEIKTEIIE